MLLLFGSLFGGLLLRNITGPYDDSAFGDFVTRYNKDYENGTLEYARRLKIFQDSIRRVEVLNRNRTHPRSAIYGVTKFSDMTPEEFQQTIIQTPADRDDPKDRPILKSVTRRRPKRSVRHQLGKSFPQRVDWRERSVISKVYNQAKCGACWAYSTVETIEAMVAIRNGTSVTPLSVQQVIDCASEGNSGCDGGDTCTALQWMAEDNVKLVPLADYPMLNDEEGFCPLEPPKHGVSIASNFTCDNFVNKEADIVKLLANHGPLVAAVDAATWQDYLGGVIHYNCNNSHNHAVQIVGYNLEGDLPYYIVRNSWGLEFGVKGYLHVAIGSNLCAIAEQISAVDVILE